MSEYTFKIGDRVQYWDEDDEEYLFGEIKSLCEGNAIRIESVSVLWDDYADPEDWATELLEPEGTEDELEVEFKKTCDEHMEEIEAQLKIASDALNKAEELSEKYGLPFSAGVSPLSQSYFPTTFPSKFGELDSDFVADITGAYSEYYGEGGGWEHSSIC